MEWMQEDFLPPLDAAQRARRCMIRENLRVADARITALLEVDKALRVKFNENYRARLRLDWDLTEIYKEIDELSNLRPELAIVMGYGAYTDLDVAFLIGAKFVCCSLIAACSLGVMVLSRIKANIAARLGQIRF